MSQPVSRCLPLCDEYVDALLDTRSHPGRAVAIIERALAEGWTPLELYVDVLPAALHEVGRRWQHGKASVADEHLATLVVQDTLRMLAQRLPRADRHGRSVIVAAVEGELHDNGPRILADLLDADGWEVFYVGAATPSDALAALVDQRQPEVVALSTTMTTHLPALEEAVAGLRAARRRPHVIVGGQACADIPGLAERVGADVCMLRADDAVAALRQRVADGAPASGG